MRPIASTWSSSLRLGAPVSAALGLISDLGAPIGDLILYALIAAGVATFAAGAYWFGGLRLRATPDHPVHSTFAFGVVSFVILSSVFGLNRLASESPERGFLASHVEALRSMQESLVRVESKLEDLTAAQQKESSLAASRSQQQAAEIERIQIQQRQAEEAAQARDTAARAEAERRDAEARERSEQLLRHAEAQRNAQAELAQRSEQQAAEQRARDAAQSAALDRLVEQQQALLAELRNATNKVRSAGTQSASPEIAAIEERLRAGDAAIQGQLSSPAENVAGPRGAYLRARELAARGESEQARKLYAEFTAACTDEYDPLEQYGRFLAEQGDAPAAVFGELYLRRELKCAGLLAALHAGPDERLASLERLRQQHPEFEVTSLFLGRELLLKAQSTGDGETYARSAAELRRAGIALEARSFDAYVLDRKQKQEWQLEIQRTLPLISVWESKQVVAKSAPAQGDCFYERLQAMRNRELISDVGQCESGDFILYRVFQTATEAASTNAPALALAEGKRAIAAWIETSVSSSQSAARSRHSDSSGVSISKSSFSSSTVTSTDVTQSGIQLYSTQPTAEGGLEYVFLLTTAATQSVKALRSAVRTPGPDGLVCVEARAIVSMSGRDEAQARDAAVQAAKQDALGQVVGVRQRTLFSQSERETGIQTSISVNNGYIKSFDIELDVRRGDVYVIELSACISLTEIDRQIGDTMKSLGNPKVLVECEAAELRRFLEGEIGKSQVSVSRDADKVDYVVRADALFEDFTFRVGTKEMEGTRLNASLALLDRDTREEMCQSTLPQVSSKIAGVDARQRACQRAIATQDKDNAAAYLAAQDFLRCMRDTFRRLASEGRPVFVEISHAPEQRTEVQALFEGLKSLPGAMSFESERNSDSLASMELRFMGESRWLAEILSRDFSDIAGERNLRLEREEISPRFVRMQVRAR